MNRKEAIEILKQCLEEISHLKELQYDNREYQLWCDKVEQIVKSIFSPEDLTTLWSTNLLAPTIDFLTPETVRQNYYLKRLDEYGVNIEKIIQKYEILGTGTPESEVIAPRFSNRTLSYIIEILAKHTDTELRNFFFKYDLLDIYKQSGKLTAKKRKVNDVFQHLGTAGDESAVHTLASIVRETVRQIYTRRFSQNFPDLDAALTADGYQVRDGELIPIISTFVKPAKEEGLVEALLNRYGFNVAKNHLEQAFDNYLGGNWEASNGALRSFLQDVFDQIALKLWPEESAKKEAGGARRKLLQEKGFIEENTEADLVRSFFKYAHGEGSHPGISDESDCRLRRYIAVALASYYLEKLGAHLVQTI